MTIQAAPQTARRPASADGIDERSAIARFARLKKLVTMQTWAIGILTLILALALPFAAPVYLYYAVKPDKKMMQLAGLPMPNMTNRAVLSWATTSITEIMTFGFGDIDTKVLQQKWRFTSEGWDSYLQAFIRKGIDKTFKQNQLVLTTAPSNTPVITAQGVGPDKAYVWVVQMPVIMTYATNNNVTSRKNGIVTLTITRVPIEQSPAGIAIKTWDLK